MNKPFTCANDTHVKSVDRAIALLELLAREKGEMTLSEISQSLGWAKSTAHGLLVTLRDHHFVDQSSENSRYRLGTRLFELGTQVASTWEIRDAARPAMVRLMREFGETVQLATDEDGEILYLEKLAPNSVVSIMSEVGHRLPMHCSGLGKVLLAEKSPFELKHIVEEKGLAPMTKRTITSPEKLACELDRVRERGYAIDDGEVMEGLRCVAVPVRDAAGKARWAMSISGQARNFTERRMSQIISSLTQAAGEATYALGGKAARF